MIRSTVLSLTMIAISCAAATSAHAATNDDTTGLAVVDDWHIGNG